MTFQPILVLITAPTHEDARRISNTLLEKKLAACVNIVSAVDSHYIWQGEINEEKEVLLIVKSREELFEERLVPAVKAVHPYDIPEIIALPIIMGSKDYLNWIEEVTCV